MAPLLVFAIIAVKDNESIRYILGILIFKLVS